MSSEYVQNVSEADKSAGPVEFDGNVNLLLKDAKTNDAEHVSEDGVNLSHHTRSNSIKKPATFKAVSVTKSFLAKAGTPLPPINKISDDKGKRHDRKNGGHGTDVPGAPMPPSTLGSQGARPRLVAKSSTGHQLGSKPVGNKYKESGPDPLQVWNKNRGL